LVCVFSGGRAVGRLFKPARPHPPRHPGWMWVAWLVLVNGYLRHSRAQQFATEDTNVNATCVINSTVGCLLDTGCPGGRHMMSCTRTEWWTTTTTVAPTLPPMFANVTMETVCTHLKTAEPPVPVFTNLPGGGGNTSAGMDALNTGPLMPAAAPVAVPAPPPMPVAEPPPPPPVEESPPAPVPEGPNVTILLSQRVEPEPETYPCNQTVLVRLPPPVPEPPTPPPPLVPGSCFCRKGCWNATAGKCMTWQDLPAVEHPNLPEVSVPDFGFR